MLFIWAALFLLIALAMVAFYHLQHPNVAQNIGAHHQARPALMKC